MDPYMERRLHRGARMCIVNQRARFNHRAHAGIFEKAALLGAFLYIFVLRNIFRGDFYLFAYTFIVIVVS